MADIHRETIPSVEQAKALQRDRAQKGLPAPSRAARSRTLSGSRFLQPKLSHFLTEKVAAPLGQVSRFLSEMTAHTLELAQRRIAASVAALKRLLHKPPPPSPPAAAPRIKPTPIPPTRKKPNGFKPS
jgi:hypothetical protein